MSLTALEILRVHQNSLKIQLTESLDWLIRMEMEYSTSQRSSQTSCLFLKESSSTKDRSLLGHPSYMGAQDTDGDHVADKKTSWFNGGSIEGCGNDLHGPYMGVDGYFYWCKGAFDPQTHLLGNGKLFKSSAAHIYRAKPDGTGLEVVITGGMNNPVGLAFGESGERF